MTGLTSQCNRITSNKKLQLGVAIFCQSVKIGTFSYPHLTFCLLKAKGVIYKELRVYLLFDLALALYIFIRQGKT